LFDVLKWWEYGLPVVGLMGSQPSEAQAKLLLEFEMVYLALDADEAGAKGTKWLKSRLKGRVPIYAVRFPEGKKDPGEMGKEEAWAAITTAKRIL
jgi:DNA primase